MMLPAPDQPDRLYCIRHSAAHIMAQAVLERFPEGKIGIGPPIEDGFYYDFDLPRNLTPEDLEAIEARMREIIREDHAFHRRELSAVEARHLFSRQPYKLELIADLEAGGSEQQEAKSDYAPVISTYQHADFEDLCRGPHVKSTGEINPNAIKLLNTAGAYWRGDERNPMLQRIYGTAWEQPEELQAYLHRLEEAAARDHRVLGRDLDLFSFSREVGPGLVLWHPKGGRIRAVMEAYWGERHLEGGYERVYTPHIGKANLWETSGHLNWYKEGMYAPMKIDEQEYFLKPMNCPFHVEIFKSQTRSFRELPMRLAEFGTVYRFERSGVLHGLLRVRGFTQDDAHLFCRPDQMDAEIERVLRFCLSILEDFGFKDFDLELSVRDSLNLQKYAGSEKDWVMAETALQSAVERIGYEYKQVEGEAVFYGPKIDIKVVDALNRPWQISTIQFDFWLPKAFDISFIGSDGQPHRPYMIHRALFGSMERFFGLLVEHYKGAFPVWLAPIQAVLVPIADRHFAFALEAANQMKAAGLRVEVDQSSDRMGNKIRKAQEAKVPYMLILGDRELDAGTVSLRLRTGEDLGSIEIGAFISRAVAAIEVKEGL